MKKSIPTIREREGNEKIHSHNSGTGIRGFHSWERAGTRIAHPCPNTQPPFAKNLVHKANPIPQSSVWGLVKTIRLLFMHLTFVKKKTG